MVEVAAIVAGWLTPTSLFVLLNIVIATIFLTSALGIGTHHAGHTTTNKSADDDHHRRSESGGNPQLLRAPSLFSRVASFNFSTHHAYSNYHRHHSDDEAGHDPAPPAFARSPSFLSRVASFNFCRAQAQPDPPHNVSVVAQEAAAYDDDDVSKEGSETDKAGDESRGEEMVMTEKKEENESEGEAKKKKKKAVVRRKKAKTVPFTGADDEVDAKADDFINKFKQQLKLQRLESLLRYRSPATVTANAT